MKKIMDYLQGWKLMIAVIVAFLGLGTLAWGALEYRLVPRPEFNAYKMIQKQCTDDMKQDVAALSKSIALRDIQAQMAYWQQQKDRAYDRMQRYPNDQQFRRDYDRACQELERLQQEYNRLR